MPVDAAVDVPVGLRPAGPIVRAAEVGLWHDAARALAQARAEAAAIRARAEAEAQALRVRARDEGRRGGAEDAARLAAEAVKRAAVLLQACEAELPVLVMALVEGVVGAMDPGERLVRATRHALGRLRRGASAVLRVCPAEAEAVRAAIAGLAGDPVSVQADPAVAPGECRFESEYAAVELGIEAQLRALRAGLLSGGNPAP